MKFFCFTTSCFSRNFKEDLYTLAAKAEEECLFEVLTQYLCRQPRRSHFNRCTKVYAPKTLDTYFLCYNGIKLGHVCRSMQPNEYTIIFKPVNSAA